MANNSTLFLVGTLLLAVSALEASASIISTSVNASVRIAEQGGLEVTDTDSGSTTAAASVAGPQNSSMSSTLIFDSLTAESANLNFNIDFDGGNLGQAVYGAAPGVGNRATINYTALIDSLLDYSWNFDYVGPEPFGLQVVDVQEGNTLLQQLGNFGQVGNHQGTDNFMLMAGTSYEFRVIFNPNASGPLGSLDGTLLGDISFNFTIPEPNTLALLGLGLAGFGFARKRMTA